MKNVSGDGLVPKSPFLYTLFEKGFLFFHFFLSGKRMDRERERRRGEREGERQGGERIWHGWIGE